MLHFSYDVIFHLKTRPNAMRHHVSAHFVTIEQALTIGMDAIVELGIREIPLYIGGR